MSEPFWDGNIAIVLLGDGLEQLGAQLKEYCARLKAAYEVAYGPERPCGFDLMPLGLEAEISEFWNAMTLPHYKHILMVSYDYMAAQRIVTEIESDARLCRIIPPEGRYAKTTYISLEHLNSSYLDYIEGSCHVDGVLLVSNSRETLPTPPSALIPCEETSALAFLKILILWDYSRLLVSVDVADLRHIRGARPVYVDVSPSIGHNVCTHVILTIKGDAGICCIAKFECAWNDLDPWNHVDTDFFIAFSEYASAKVGPDDNVIFFDLWEPVAILEG